ncbi:MAG TPA: Rieske (2Fe-2S) protein [Methylomirabilota bacterium]|jgi:nitrite reductase/ring-hydroxylating ferredoxin subunit|nr:Rieske (2Fe-2S) protein [Methylomirabilota bacterium]
MATHDPQLIRVGKLQELQARGCVVVSAGAHGVAVFWHEGRAWAVDNRCPHMGFPLSRGTVQDGLLTCHWHHARFDLASGGTLDPFAGDVRAYPAVVRDGEVFVEVRADDGERPTHWWRRLEQGLEDQLSLALAKATLALLGAGADPREIVRAGARFGARYRAAGWGPGLTILTAMANLLPTLGAEEQPLALFHGLLRVAEDCAGQPPRFGLDPLPGRGLPLRRLKAWFRRAVEVRDAEGAERTLRTAIESGVAPAALADILFVAVTDHYFVDAGHQLDYLAKAFELMDHLGWEEAPAILPSLVGGLCRAERSEERSAWRHPVDLPALLEPAFGELGSLAGDPAAGRRLGAAELDALVETLLGDEPRDAVAALLSAMRQGTALAELGQAIAHAASLRIARFPTSNEFGDWDTVHNTASSCNALHQALWRAPSRELARGLFHAAMRIYLDRFLNVPPARLPDELPAEDVADAPGALLERLDREQQVNPAGRLVHAHLAAGRPEAPLLQSLGRAVLREDAGFHDYQALEGGLRQYAALGARHPAAARRALVATARFVAAHCPTPRALGQTYRIALRLQRGEELYQAAE